MTDEKVQRVYTVPLGKAYEYTRTKRARRTVDILRTFLARHMKVHPGFVRISEQVNEFIWARSMQKPPRRVKVSVVKENGLVKASLPDEKPKKSNVPVKKEKKVEAKAETKPAEKKEAKAETKTEAKPEKKAAEKPAKKEAKKEGEAKK